MTMRPAISIFTNDKLPSARKTLPEHRNVLLRNRGSVQFDDVREKAGVQGSEYAFGASVAHYQPAIRIISGNRVFERVYEAYITTLFHDAPVPIAS